MQLLGVARRNGASLGEETLDSLIATNIQVDHHYHDDIVLMTVVVMVVMMIMMITMITLLDR